MISKCKNYIFLLLLKCICNESFHVFMNNCKRLLWKVMFMCIYGYLHIHAYAHMHTFKELGDLFKTAVKVVPRLVWGFWFFGY